jgi:hypothetical protein
VGSVASALMLSARDEAPSVAGALQKPSRTFSSRSSRALSLYSASAVSYTAAKSRRGVHSGRRRGATANRHNAADARDHNGQDVNAHGPQDGPQGLHERVVHMANMVATGDQAATVRDLPLMMIDRFHCALSMRARLHMHAPKHRGRHQGKDIQQGWTTELCLCRSASQLCRQHVNT